MWYEEQQRKALDNNKIPFPVTRRSVMRDAFFNCTKDEIKSLHKLGIGKIVSLQFGSKTEEYVIMGSRPLDEDGIVCLVRNDEKILWFFNEDKKLFFTEQVVGGLNRINKVPFKDGTLKDKHDLYIQTALMVSPEFKKEVIFLIDRDDVANALDCLFEPSKYLVKGFNKKTVKVII